MRCLNYVAAIPVDATQSNCEMDHKLRLSVTARPKVSQTLIARQPRSSGQFISPFSRVVGSLTSQAAVPQTSLSKSVWSQREVRPCHLYVSDVPGGFRVEIYSEVTS
jgi:hypothetical protein